QELHYETLIDDSAWAIRVAELLARGCIVGLFQGRMEFGPRALGNRSIVADPRDAGMIDALNRRIKGREGFRPFAPSVLEERAHEYFDVDGPAPYMTRVASVARAQHRSEDDRPVTRASGKGRATESGVDGLNLAARLRGRRSTIPAVTHIDRTARLQTVSQSANPRYHLLLRAFAERTGCPVLLNTSFNGADEPIVCSPADALTCFRRTGLDVLALGPLIVHRDRQG
ncbi:MAG: carbamoyltransferase C-terminal domain-containing protein, partial [Myxococcota bacterium]